jgi:hypothetical protein
MTHCMFEGCESADGFTRFGPYGIRTGWICETHRAELRSHPFTPIKAALWDAPTHILDAALVVLHGTQSQADRAYHRRLREQRKAIDTELRVRR